MLGLGQTFDDHPDTNDEEQVSEFTVY